MNKILVAKIGKAVALKGFLRLHILSDFPYIFKKDNTFSSIDDRKFKIKSFDKERSLVLFEGYEDVNLARELTNLELYKSLEETRKECKLKKDEFFYFDIISCEVFEDGEKIGEVFDILQTSASYLFLVKTTKTIRANFAKEFYLPYVDFYIDSVDIKSKKIYAKNTLELLKSI